MKIKIFTLTLVLGLCSSAQASLVTSFGPYSEKIYSSEKADTNGNDYFGLSYNFSNDISFESESDIPYAFNVGTDNTVITKVFKQNFVLANISGGLSINEANSDRLGRFSYRVRLFNKDYWKQKEAYTISPGSSAIIWSTKDSAGKEKYSVYNEQTQTFPPIMLGPVPVTFRAGFEGISGIQGELEYKESGSANIGFKFGPDYGVNAIAGASVNVGVAKADAKASLGMIHAQYGIVSNAQVSLLRQNARLKIDVPFVMSSLNGKVSVTASVPGIKICSKRIFGKRIKYPCGVEWKKVKTWNLFDWKGLSERINIFSYEKVWQ